jgi:hypothetical protein
MDPGQILSEIPFVEAVFSANKQKRPLRALCCFITKTGGVNKQ